MLLVGVALQFPFWASKVIVTGQPHKFGMPIIHAYVNSMKNIYTTRGIRGLFEVSLHAYFHCNFCVVRV